jgi:hypothetical protein
MPPGVVQLRDDGYMEFGFGDLAGHVVGKSQGDGGPVQAYAVYLTDRERVYMVEPTDLIADRS